MSVLGVNSPQNSQHRKSASYDTMSGDIIYTAIELSAQAKKWKR
jgi:hypothetical protein